MTVRLIAQWLSLICLQGLAVAAAMNLIASYRGR